MYTVPSARRRGDQPRPSSPRWRHGRRARLPLPRSSRPALAQPEAMALYERHGWHASRRTATTSDSPQSVCFAKAIEPAAHDAGHAVLGRAPPRPGSRRSPWSSPGRTPPGSSCRWTPCRCTAGMDIGTAKPTAAEQAEVPPPPARPARPVGGRHRRLVPAAGAGRDRRTSSSAATARCWSAGRRSTCKRSWTTSRSPGSTPTCAPILESDGDTRALHAQLVELDPVAAGRMEPTNRRRIVRALEVTIGSGRPSRATAPASTPIRRPRSPWSGSGAAQRRPARPDRGPVRRSRWTRGSSTRCAGCGPNPVASRAPPVRPSGTRSCSSTSTARVTLDEALDLAIRRTGRFARRQWAWFRRDPRITWLDADPRRPRRDLVDALLAAV